MAYILDQGVQQDHKGRYFRLAHWATHSPMSSKTIIIEWTGHASAEFTMMLGSHVYTYPHNKPSFISQPCMNRCGLCLPLFPREAS